MVAAKNVNDLTTINTDKRGRGKDLKFDDKSMFQETNTFYSCFPCNHNVIWTNYIYFSPVSFVLSYWVVRSMSMSIRTIILMTWEIKDWRISILAEETGPNPNFPFLTCSIEFDFFALTCFFLLLSFFMKEKISIIFVLSMYPLK